MVTLVIFRMITPAEAVAGFSHPAVITVGSMFLISKGMLRTGAVGYIGQKVIQMARGNFKLAMLVILLTVAVASAFINNTPVVVLFIPVVMSMCCQFNLSPSKFLIPVSYASILAGAAIRVFGPVVAPLAYKQTVVAGGSLWALAFVLFLVHYTPILTRPRPDGRPG